MHIYSHVRLKIQCMQLKSTNKTMKKSHTWKVCKEDLLSCVLSMVLSGSVKISKTESRDLFHLLYYWYILIWPIKRGSHEMRTIFVSFQWTESSLSLPISDLNKKMYNVGDEKQISTIQKVIQRKRINKTLTRTEAKSPCYQHSPGCL